MSVTVKYETIDNAVGNNREYGRGARNLGKSDQSNLTRAFVSPVNSGTYTEADAARIFSLYGGENTSYGLQMYRRNFTPDPDAGEIYSDPRDKDTTPVGAAGLPATPYSPNVASPGEGNGVTATAISQQVVGLVPVNARPQDLLNPKQAVFQNQNATGFGNVGDGPITGKVRTFRLGIGSGTARDISNP